MDNFGRRNRRGRAHARALHVIGPVHNRSCVFLSRLYSLLVVTSVFGLIYLMLENHNSSIPSKFDNITICVEDVAKNLSAMKQSYHSLEHKVTKFSEQLPKLEEQIEILEALATALDNKSEKRQKTGKKPNEPLKAHMIQNNPLNKNHMSITRKCANYPACIKCKGNKLVEDPVLVRKRNIGTF